MSWCVVFLSWLYFFNYTNSLNKKYASCYGFRLGKQARLQAGFKIGSQAAPKEQGYAKTKPDVTVNAIGEVYMYLVSVYVTSHWSIPLWHLAKKSCGFCGFANKRLSVCLCYFFAVYIQFYPPEISEFPILNCFILTMRFFLRQYATTGADRADTAFLRWMHPS